MDENLKNALKAHDLYWTSYINGQADVVESLLDENYQQIGSVEEEVFFNKKDAIGFVKKTIDQVTGKVEIRNRVTKSEKLSGYILINEFFDLYVKTDENWFFYSKFRTSSLMQQKADGWKLVHQHSSMPDSKAEEGENIAIEKINQENLELKNAIKRRTIELEHKNRELEIEAALERVRAKAMAMRKSDELTDVAVVLFKELKKLGIEPRRCGFAIKQPEGPVWQFWHTTKDGQAIEKAGRLSEEQVPFFKDVFTVWKDGEVESHTSTFSGAELDHVIHFLIERTEVNLPDAETEVQQGIYPTQVCFNFFFFKHGSLLAHTLQPLKEENRKVLERFARIFEQTYTRFLDLKKAEAQAREAQIEAALERVRSRTIGMQRSDELQKAAALMFQQIKSLGVDIMGCGFNIWDDDRKEATAWMSGMERIQPPFKTSSSRDIFLRIFEAAQRGDSLFVEEQAGEELIEHYKYMASIPVFKKILDNLAEKGLSAPSFQIMHCAFFSQGYLMFITHEPASNDYDIFKRFAKVFEQTYIRFLDLQKAEEQAREAQIEAALERVRARSMGMHHSSELFEVVRVLDQEIKGLGIHNVDATQIATDLSKPLEGLNVWIKVEEMNYLKKFHIPFIDHPVLQNLADAYKKKDTFYTEKYSKAEKNRFFRLLFKYSDLKSIPEERKKVLLNSSGLIRSVVIHKNSALFFHHNGVDEFSNEDNAIFKRFGIVFEQAYTRFMDLQKAEEQARETQVELALERIRSRTMAMQESGELAEVSSLLFRQMDILGINTYSSGFTIWDEARDELISWMCNADGSMNPPFRMPIDEEKWHKEQYESWKKGEDFIVKDLTDDQMKAYFKYLRSFPLLDEAFEKSVAAGHPMPERQIHHVVNFSQGNLLFITLEPVPDAHGIFKRFANVFEQTYTRFLDLQKAEEQAREATKQASLDRVRGEIASMRSAKDLEIITPLVWNELNTLGIPFIRCGIFIVHEEEEEVEVYLSKPDGTSLAVMHLSFGSSDLVNQTVDAWRNSSVHTQHWTQEEFLDWGRSMVEQGQVQDLESYRGAEAPPESLNLHFIPFKQGMLYVGSTNSLGGDEVDLAASLAKAFSIAYARYEDFVKLEKAKRSIEEALTELKATQSQLVQQEKLASLGQLTAGIAHEIKNPLNFVNNFSDLSIELVEEAREEVKRQMADVKRETQESPFEGGKVGEANEGDDHGLILAILNDIEANLRKIHEHGSRADGIVKSMLQHSRGGDGKMEPTDLNALIKEYVNLAFHGMRAGNDPINVDIDLQLDEDVGEVPLVAEDFSRVILNICNNAFDAMREKQGSGSKGQGAGDYQPKLTVRTFQQAKTITIDIEDNGPGIPEEIKDKILQPFFTTKKGTQGTGLGLSITNDIVKAHRGTIEIYSSDAGTLFNIAIPSI